MLPSAPTEPLYSLSDDMVKPPIFPELQYKSPCPVTPKYLPMVNLHVVVLCPATAE